MNTYTAQDYSGGFRIVVDIDQNRHTEQAVKEMVEFWTDWEIRLDHFGGDYNKAFVQQLGAEMMRGTLNKGWRNALRDISFSEGYYDLERVGIRVTSCCEFEMPEIEVEQLNALLTEREGA